MITSRQTTLLSEIEPGKNIPAGVLVYFQTRAKNALHDFVMAKFFERERNARLTKAELARRIGRKPEVISRLFGAPGNWTIETVSDLLVGIAGEELEPASSSIAAKIERSEPLPEWASKAMIQGALAGNQTNNLMISQLSNADGVKRSNLLMSAR